MQNGCARWRSVMFDWNDLKYLLAVAHHGSTLAAARHLGVNQSTVQRRLTETGRTPWVTIGRAIAKRLQPHRGGRAGLPKARSWLWLFGNGASASRVIDGSGSFHACVSPERRESARSSAA
ncbi:LysR family transcriptional regulator [Bradyrhizobium sp. DN5]|uniref:LysR family transcriptional regulator n=1 Tax=Bradyrhizobium sp. DN5 TaxID=3056950 RepID=UPI0035237DB1